MRGCIGSFIFKHFGLLSSLGDPSWGVGIAIGETAETRNARRAATLRLSRSLSALSASLRCMKPTQFWKGHPYPLGATWAGNGVNFTLFSENATGVELCLFGELGAPETSRVRLRERTDYIWHIF